MTISASLDLPPESDCIDGAPHPRMAPYLLGQSKAEQDFLDAATQGRLHHAWLLSGPRGIGKATLAWRIARFLLTLPATGIPDTVSSLNPPDDHPALPRIKALSDPRLLLLRRSYDPKTSKFKNAILIDDIRRLHSFFTLSAAESGYRVVIIDTADDMNTHAANALLKFLEEPPDKAILLLVSHRPSGLLPTIRSRCRVLRCNLLPATDITTILQNMNKTLGDRGLTTLAAGSAGEAVRILMQDGEKMYHDLIHILEDAPKLDRAKIFPFIHQFSDRRKTAAFDMITYLLHFLLARLAKTSLVGVPNITVTPQESYLLERLGQPQHAQEWAKLQQETTQALQAGLAVNLDPVAMLLDVLWKIENITMKP